MQQPTMKRRHTEHLTYRIDLGEYFDMRCEGCPALDEVSAWIGYASCRHIVTATTLKGDDVGCRKGALDESKETVALSKV